MNWGEAELFLGIWGAKANTLRETRKLFAGRGEINALFSGIKGAQIPRGLFIEHFAEIKQHNVDLLLIIESLRKALYVQDQLCNLQE